MHSRGNQFGLAYLDADAVGAYLEERKGHVLNVIGFGRIQPLTPMLCMPLWVDIPLLDGKDSSFEVWTSDAPVKMCEHNGICGTTDGKVLCASLVLEQQSGETMESLTSLAYTRIFDFIDHFNCCNLLRVWNYFPQINDAESGLERYQNFNIGRHAAYVAHNRSVGEENAPAASVLGSDSGSLTIYFMAGKLPGKTVENPRQVSAYHYPNQFGPRSPIFARALLATLGKQSCFFISGTASIVGYETLHHGDAEKQASETLLNLRTLLQQITPRDPPQGRILLKVYVRHAHDLAMLQSKVQAEFGSDCKAIYLHSNICRSDLLLEIEGVYFNNAIEPNNSCTTQED